MVSIYILVYKLIPLTIVQGIIQVINYFSMNVFKSLINKKKRLLSKKSSSLWQTP